MIRFRAQYRYRYLVNDWIDVSKDDLILLDLDREALLMPLASAIEGSPRGIKAFADGRLTRLGFVTPSFMPKEPRHSHGPTRCPTRTQKDYPARAAIDFRERGCGIRRSK